MRVPVLSATVPSPLDCLVSSVNWQQLAELLYVNLPDSATQINFGSLTPSPSQRGNPWVRTTTTGTPTGLWVFSNGFWLSPHPAYDPVNDLMDTDRLMLWLGADVDIDALDGGEAGAVTDFSGPMWTKFTDIGAKFPLAVGTLPSGKIINVGDTGGEEQHTLIIDELPAFTPAMKFNFAKADGDFTPDSPGNDLLGSTNPTVTTPSPLTKQGEPIGGGLPHNNIPPYYGLQVLRKSPRKFYRLPA